MKILIDESLPRYLKRLLADHDVQTVQDMGWAGLKNGPLLTRAEALFDLFLTADKNLRYQQNLRGRTLAIMVFPSNRLSVVKTLEGKLKASIEQVTGGAYIEL
ncbi:MAG TPA: DUF5615 family PIN-like protein [Candidatus Tectomicrobia bacterium]